MKNGHSRFSTEKKVAILHQGFVPTYRVRFYELLNRESTNHYVVFHGPPPSNTGYDGLEEKLDFPHVRTKNHELRFFGRTVIYQPVMTTILFGSYDAVVLGHEIRFISNVLILAFFKLLGKPVIWWGQGFEKEQDRKFRALSQLVEKVKSWLARSADAYIVYTDGGCQKLIQSRVPKEKITVVRNTIDMEEQCLLHDKFKNMDPVQFREENNLRPDSIVLLYVGRVYREKRLEEILYLVKRINSEKLCRSFVEVVIIGGGSELDRLKRIGIGIEGVHFLGEVYDQETIAKFMQISSTLIIPGKVGLAVNHAFAHGLPVITRQHRHHAPEVEYIVSGENGLITPGDFDDFLRETVDLLNSPERQKRMSKAALETRELLRLDLMVKAFDEATSRAINQKAKTLVKDLPRAHFH
ncbi:MAG: glycosyltransferase [candidate division Zixibacteria bacterium]|nr:glycosyltransferase [candidate division Zixibacteria bacterium]